MRSTVVINQDLRPLRSRTRSLLNFMQYFHSCNPQSLLHLESHFSVGIYHDFGEQKKNRRLSAEVDDSIQCHNLYLLGRAEGPALGPCPHLNQALRTAKLFNSSKVMAPSIRLS